MSFTIHAVGGAYEALDVGSNGGRCPGGDDCGTIYFDLMDLGTLACELFLIAADHVLTALGIRGSTCDRAPWRTLLATYYSSINVLVPEDLVGRCNVGASLACHKSGIKEIRLSEPKSVHSLARGYLKETPGAIYTYTFCRAFEI